VTPKKGQEWAALGCEIALANISITFSLVKPPLAASSEKWP